MNESKNLDAILEELYAADPALRAQAASLRKLAEELLASKPDVQLDSAFVAKLRAELTAKAQASPAPGFLARFFSARNAMYLAPGLAALVLAVAATLTLSPRASSGPAARGLALATGVERLGAGAFGSLSASPSDESAPAAESNSVSGMRPLSPATAQVSAPGTAAPSPGLPPDAGGGMGAAGKMMILPNDWQPTVYKYVYKGDPIVGLKDAVDVYKRVNAPAGAGPIVALRGAGLGLIDLGALKDASVQTFSIAEGGADGYVVSVNPEEGSISVNENSKWSYPERLCADQACSDSYRLKESDMLSDAAAVSAADAMLKKFGVTKSGYGVPVARDDWRANYAAADDKADYWFPDTVTVVYPYLIDGKPATDEGGAPYGLDVNVNVSRKRASSLWNLRSSRFQASSYDGETDAARLMGIAENGGLQGSYMADNAKVVEIDLGTPTVSYSRVWQSTSDGGSELFAPSLTFPVMNPPKDFWQTGVTVPLAKDLLKAAADQPMPVPMPLIQNR